MYCGHTLSHREAGCSVRGNLRVEEDQGKRGYHAGVHMGSFQGLVPT